MVLAVVVVGGSYVRLADLGASSFHNDELNHVFTARAMANGDGPTLPSGLPYTRGIDVSRLVGIGVRHMEPIERGARFPSAVFGVLGLVIFGAVAWKIAGPWPAVVSVLLLAVYPEAIQQSRITRFYTYQLLFGLIALFAGWRALSKPTVRSTTGRDVLIRWLWLLAACLALALALRIQVTTLSIFAGLSVAVALAAIVDLATHGLAIWKRSMPVQATMLGLVLGLAILILRPEVYGTAWYGATYVLAWARGPGSPLYYYYRLWDTFPLFVALLPASVLVVGMRDVRLAGYLLLWFAVPLTLHSFIMASKGERYVILATPAFLLISAIAFCDVVRWSYSALTRRLAEGGIDPRRSRALATLLVFIAFSFALATNPAANDVAAFDDSRRKADWRAAGSIIEDLPGLATLPIAASVSQTAAHYWPKIDFIVSTDYAAQAARDWDHARGDLPSDEPLIDSYVGIPLLTTPDAIRARYPEADSIIIGVDRNRWRFGNLDQGLKAALSQDGQDICAGRCNELMLFVWTPPAEATSNGTTR